VGRCGHERKDIRLKRVIDECRKIGVQVRFLSRVELDKLAGNARIKAWWPSLQPSSTTI